ncbi:MAG: aspartate/glutamate racemase family protein [bacterium]|nr:aspartate/glutamate racemase family protein [bacterium]
MKTISLLGGMSWESTTTYYELINEVIKEQLGGFHSARCILFSVDFDEIEICQSQGKWEECGEILLEAAKSLENAGADFILICTNTMHKVVKQIQAGIHIPILHIADATADELINNHIKKIALLGTKYTMTQDFYKSKLVERGIEVMIPEYCEIERINDIIFNELCMGNVTKESKQEVLHIMDSLSKKGAEGVILGCTELGLLIKQADTDVRVFDTTLIHATKGALYAIETK